MCSMNSFLGIAGEEIKKGQLISFGKDGLFYIHRDTKKMTVKEIEEELGCKVEIVREK